VAFRGALRGPDILLGAWSFVGTNNTSTENEDFSQHFEQTMLATVNDSEEVW